MEELIKLHEFIEQFKTVEGYQYGSFSMNHHPKGEVTIHLTIGLSDEWALNISKSTADEAIEDIINQLAE